MTDGFNWGGAAGGIVGARLADPDSLVIQVASILAGMAVGGAIDSAARSFCERELRRDEERDLACGLGK